MRLASALAVVTLLGCAVPTRGQAPTMGHTLRYGSGLLDVPVASVLPHLQLRATYSGFWTDVDRAPLLDPSGAVVGFTQGSEAYHDDGSLTVGLFDRGEVGLSLQSLGDSDSGGRLWGMFGRLNVFQPRGQGIGFALGGRYLTRPQFADGIVRASGRLGFPDVRLVRRFEGSDQDMRTRFSWYGVATAQLRGVDASRIPENDLTLSLGWGGGMFRGTSGTELYGDGSNGWFLGASSHWRIGTNSVLQIMAEHNGFDVNVGAQFEASGIRVGLHALGVNHPRPPGGYWSEYRSPKLGFSVSASVCPGQGRLRCTPRLMERVEPDTIWIPPPPPDTVMVGEPGAAVPQGVAAFVCLSTGQNAPIRMTEAGDTLVGPAGTPISTLRPVVDFAGQYAGGAEWYARGEEILFEGERFVPMGEPFDVDCGQILRVGSYQGVPLFADRAAIRPIEVLFVPVAVGIWRRFEHPEEMAWEPHRRFTPDPGSSTIRGVAPRSQARARNTSQRFRRHR